MSKTFFSCGVGWRWLIPLIACGCLLFFASNQSVRAQSAISEQEVVVSGEEVPSAYGAPPGFSRSRFSNLTQAMGIFLR